MTIEWSRKAESDIRKLDPPIAKRISAALDRFAETEHGDVVRLQGCDEYRLRVGDWRVRFRLESGNVAVILRIGHRSEAYR